MIEVEVIKDKISALLPDLKKALKEPGDQVEIGGVDITRLEAERMCDAFEKELASNIEECQLEWDMIPLKLAVANRNWRSLQESLNQIV